MIRILIALTIALSASAASASGKLIAQANGYNDGRNTRPMVGFTVYERFFKTMAFNGFVGSGIQDLEVSEDVNWFVAKAQIDFELSKGLRGLTFSPGIMHKRLFGEEVSDNVGFARLTYQLW